MEPIFDRHGKLVAWIAVDVVYDRERHPRAFLSEGAIFTYQRRFLGWFDNGYVRDARGLAVGWTHGATGGPATPDPEGVGKVPVPRMTPLPPMPPVVPSRPSWTPSWSSISWEGFFAVEALR